MHTEHSSSVDTPLPSDAPICPLTRIIFLNPVKLLPKHSKNWNVGTAIVEKENWDKLVHSNSSAKCPITRIEVSGYIASYEMKENVSRYLSEHPEQKDNQYKQEVAQAILPISPESNGNNPSLIINQNASEPRSLRTEMDALILGFWRLDWCASNTGGKALQLAASVLCATAIETAVFTAMNAGATALGAYVLGYDMNSAAKATAVGSALFFGVFGLVMTPVIFIPDIYPSISSMQSRSEAHASSNIRPRSEDRDVRTPPINAGLVFGSILLLACLEAGISIIGQQILHGGSDDKINLSQLAKASALGISFFSIPLSIKTVCRIKDEEEQRNQMRSR